MKGGAEGASRRARRSRGAGCAGRASCPAANGRDVAVGLSVSRDRCVRSCSGLADWKRKPRIDWREKLAPEVFDRFVKLRERRKKIAAEDGVPPYMVMTDAQMAEAAGFECLTSDTFRRIEGFGEARIAKYASRLLEGGNQT